MPSLSPKLDQRGCLGMTQRDSVGSGLSRFTTSTAGSDDDDLATALDELDREMTSGACMHMGCKGTNSGYVSGVRTAAC